MKPGDTHSPVNPRLTADLNTVHGLLLNVHKALLEHERVRYEAAHGPVLSQGELLDLVIRAPWFAWLRTLSGLITQIDEFLCAKEPPSQGAGEALLTRARDLLSSTDDGSDFHRDYRRALQESSEVGHAHGQWKLALLQLDRKS